MRLGEADAEREGLPATTSTDFIRLSVADSGDGIEPGVLERIFDPYFTTKEVGRGTGMGLAVVHGIVNNHGGEIRVSSEPGAGSEVSRSDLPLTEPVDIHHDARCV
ncbi:MAG: ATP-binding protein [Gammaproteobacteria bacterium]|nr:ATP-binding protein [Gammaproteobacteria bacterium]